MDRLRDLLFTAQFVNAEWLRCFSLCCNEIPNWQKRTEHLIQDEYAQNSAACDGYARVGCWLLEQECFNEALVWFEKEVLSQRFSWWQQLRRAECLGAIGDLTQAETIIDKVYANHPEARNGFAMLGVRLDRADVAQRDVAASRLTPGYALNVAVLLSQSGALDDACQLVRWAYAANSSLHDGYVRVANPWLKKRSFPEALIGYRLEAEANRMSTTYRLSYADLLARADEWDAAEAEIAQAYREDKSLNDGYAMLGNQCVSMHQESCALQWYQRDAQEKRLTSSSRLIYANLLAWADEWDAAEAEIAQAYRDDESLHDGYARLGHLLWEKRNTTKALELYTRDVRLSRLTPKARLDYAELLILTKHFDKAETEVDQAYKEDPSLRDGYIRLLNHFELEQYTQMLSCYGKELQLLRATSSGKMLGAMAVRSQSTLQGELASFANESDDVNIYEQYHVLQQATNKEKNKGGKVRVLHSELNVPNYSDALIQFRELILQGNYYFESSMESPFIIDGGANMGMAMAYFKWLFPSARILAFEPHPVMHEICAENIKCNAWNNITLHRSALLDHDTHVIFNALKNMPMGSSITDRLSAGYRHEEVQQFTVAGCRLSPYINTPIDFLKLDIEGAETRVMRELGDCLTLVRRGFIEYHYGIHSNQNSLGELLNILESAGFSYHLADPPARAVGMPLHGKQVTFNHPWSCSIFFQRAAS